MSPHSAVLATIRLISDSCVGTFGHRQRMREDFGPGTDVPTWLL